ncbi:MAG: HNH endonuclease domain-containing protein, partial [Sphaerochaeta sp.]|nr:HNH endonuclease domain-containing protein [Sphaerochaeta sp.]
MSLPELGYALYHIANHRGASSIRTFLDDEKSSDDEKLDEQIRETEKLAKVKGLSTFIEVLAAFNENKLIGYRNIDTLKASKVPVPTRDIIENEITTLLSTQNTFYPGTLSAEYQQKILDAILYENEKIVPEAGNCPYYPDEKKLPKCHFLNEERRIWEAINNARVIVPEQQNRGFIKWIPTPFTESERKNLFVFLREGKDLTPTAVKKMFEQYKNWDMTLQGRDVKVQKIKGFRFKDLEERPFWKSFNEDQQDQFLYAWVNTPDDKKLKKILVNQFNLSDDVASEAMKTVKLIGDYAPIGKTATKLILKYLEEGASYTEAIEKGVEVGELNELKKWEVQEQLPYYGEILTGSTQAIMGKYWHSAFKEKRDLAGFHKPKTYWEEEHYGRIANPVVHQSLNELRKLLNEMIDILGSKPTEIVVELGRELKLGAQKRSEIIMDQNKREKESARLFAEYCLPNNLSKRYIHHFRLLTQQQFICPYCLETINVSEVANGDADIDHIFPRRETADDSLANQVVSHGHCNKLKGKRTPYAAFSNSDNWSQIMHYMAANPDMYAKRKKFEKNEEEYKRYLESRGFVSRFKTDNSYIAKAVLEYLRCLYPTTDLNSVRSLNGRETSILRKAWDLQKISTELGDLHILKNKDENAL